MIKKRFLKEISKSMYLIKGIKTIKPKLPVKIIISRTLASSRIFFLMIWLSEKKKPEANIAAIHIIDYDPACLLNIFLKMEL